MNTLTRLVMSPARMVVHTGRWIMRSLFFSRVVDQMKRTGPVEDLGVLVKLATRGYWNAITPIQNRSRSLPCCASLRRRARDVSSRSGPLAVEPFSFSPELPRQMPNW